MRIPQRTEPADSETDVEKFKRLDAILKKALISVKTASAGLSRSNFPPDWVGQSELNQFLKSRGIILTSADEDALPVFDLFFSVSAALSPETILDVLTSFNPARAKAVTP